MGTRCLLIILILNTCTLDTHTAVHSGNTLWAPDVFKLYMIMNTCTLDTHTAVAPGYTLWAPDVPWIHILL